MSCDPIVSVDGAAVGVVCRPATEWFLSVDACPICGYSAGVMGMFQEWYGTQWTCLACGDQWADGELLERPWRRGWRRDSVLSAMRYMDKAQVLTPIRQSS